MKGAQNFKIHFEILFGPGKLLLIVLENDLFIFSSRRKKTDIVVFDLSSQNDIQNAYIFFG